MDTVKAKKSLGQNFLKDEVVLEKILEIAELSQEDLVLEIGPGTGLLTDVIASSVKKVLAIEIDERLAVKLQEKYKLGNVEIVQGDILSLNLPDLLEERGFKNGRYKVVANIPYYITASIIRLLLSLPLQPISLTLMVQDEVADRITALPGQMSLLSLMAQYYSVAEKKLFVPKTAFDPVPNVDSAVIHLIPKRVYSRENDKKLFRLARAGFAARRKTLVNNLSSAFSLSRDVVEQKLESLNIRKDIRAQALSLSDWEKLVQDWHFS